MSTAAPRPPAQACAGTTTAQPFQRLSARRPADDGGLGLGLSVVAAIAKAHRATLAIEPGPGGGLDIEISFPAVAATPSARPRALISF